MLLIPGLSQRAESRDIAAVDTSATIRSRPAFLQGKISGATSPKGLTAQARADFGGVAPAPPAVRLRSLGRPARIANRLADRALPCLLLVRANRKPCLDTTLQAVRLAIFPARARVRALRAARRPLDTQQEEMTGRSATRIEQDENAGPSTKRMPLLRLPHRDAPAPRPP